MTPEEKEEYQERMGSPEMECLQHQTDFPEQHDTMSHQPSKSNEDILEEFLKEFVIDGNECRIVAFYNEDDKEIACWRDYKITNWLQTVLAAKDAETKKAVEEERWRCAGIVENYLSPTEPERVDDILRDVIDDINDTEQWPIGDNGEFILTPPEDITHNSPYHVTPTP